MLANSVADKWASVPFFLVCVATGGFGMFVATSSGRVETRRTKVLGWVLLAVFFGSLFVGLSLIGVSGNG
jgi:hypothetical protein